MDEELQATVLNWASRVFLTIAVLEYTPVGLLAYTNGAFELSLMGEMEKDVFTDLTKDKVYEMYAGVQDPVLRRLMFHHIILLRVSGIFKIALASYHLFSIIFLPFEHRFASHFIYTWVAGALFILDQSLGHGANFVVFTDILAKFNYDPIEYKIGGSGFYYAVSYIHFSFACISLMYYLDVYDSLHPVVLGCLGALGVLGVIGCASKWACCKACATKGRGNVVQPIASAEVTDA